MGINVTLVGNLTRDFEVKAFESGKSILRGSMAVNERKLNRDTGKWEDGDTTFIELVVFNGLMENVANSLGKGNQVIVEGALRVRSWDKEDGSKGHATEVLVNEIGPSLRFATATVTKNPKRSAAAGNVPPDDEGAYLS